MVETLKAVKKEDRAVQVGISFPSDVFEEIEKKRGKEDRSKFVCRMLKEYFQVKPWIIHDALEQA